MSSAVVLRQCPHCDKSFINSSFLQNHLQRRHPDEFEMQQSRSDSEKKSQLDVLKEKEQETLHRDLVRELDRFKAEEMARTDRKIEDSRDGIRREMEFLYTRNFQARIVSRSKTPTPTHRLTQRTHAAAPSSGWSSCSRSRIKTADRAGIKNLSSHPPATKIVEVPVIFSAPAPEPKPKRVVREEAAPSAPPPQQLEPIQEMSEEDRDSSSVSERRRPPVSQPVDSRRAEATPAPERRDRPTPGQSGLKNTELSGILPQVTSAREGVAREVPQYWRHREDVLRHLEQRLQDRRRGSEPASGASRDKARSAAATATRAKQAKTPQPTPRTRTAALPRISTPGTKTSSKASVPKYGER
ncbi:hypothetical protein NHX12_016132, partial [Muraenolepis orangiensis]